MNIWVFGSNEQGCHGKGAALYAVQNHGARYGQGEGLQGSSYAIPTKSTPWKSLPLDKIRNYVNTFMEYARMHPDDIFTLTPIGTGLAGYTHQDIAPMFRNYPKNVVIPKVWNEYM